MGHTNWLNDEEMQAWIAFISAATLVDRELDQQLKEDMGLSHLQYTILVTLNGAESGAMRMTELAERRIMLDGGRIVAGG